MEKITAAGFLNDARCLAEQIRHAREKIEQTDAMLDVRGYDPTRERVSGSGKGDVLAERLEDLQRYRDELAGLLATYLELQRFAGRVVGSIDDPRHAQVLNMFYLEDAPIRRIAKSMGYSETRIKQIKREALKSLDAMLAQDAEGGEGEG